MLAAPYRNGTNGDKSGPLILGPDGIPLRRFTVEHQDTFAAVYNQTTRVYRWTYDQALLHDRENAVNMENDAFLQGLLQERFLPTSQLPWHLESDNPEDPRQRQTVEELTKEIERTPNLERLFYSLLYNGEWYGRGGVQVALDYVSVSGKNRLVCIDHAPVNGDKINFQWDAGEGRPTPCVMLYSGDLKQFPNSEILYTEQSPSLRLSRPEYRQRFIIHTHFQKDVDYWKPELAGAINGLGLRGMIYWNHFLLMEARSWLMDYFERIGMGITLVKYALGDPASQKQAEQVGEQQSRNTIVIYGVPMGDEHQTAGIERIEVPTSGADFVLNLLEKQFEEPIQRVIVGQTLSSDHTGSGGLGGSGAADFQADTKYRIIRSSAGKLGSTLTTDFVSTIQYWNHRDTFPSKDNPQGFHVRLVFDVDTPNPKERLEAAEKVFNMGATVGEAQVMEYAGLSTPKEGEAVLKKAPEGQPGSPEQGQGGLNQPTPDKLPPVGGTPLHGDGGLPPHPAGPVNGKSVEPPVEKVAPKGDPEPVTSSKYAADAEPDKPISLADPAVQGKFLEFFLSLGFGHKQAQAQLAELLAEDAEPERYQRVPQPEHGGFVRAMDGPAWYAAEFKESPADDPPVSYTREIDAEPLTYAGYISAPESPGPGWVETAPGPRGGKRWVRGDEKTGKANPTAAEVAKKSMSPLDAYANALNKEAIEKGRETEKKFQERIAEQAKNLEVRRAAANTPEAKKAASAERGPLSQTSTKQLPSIQSVADFRTGIDKVVRKGNRTFVSGPDYADREVQSDVMTPEFVENAKKLKIQGKLAMAIEATRKTPYLSEEGKKERLAVFDSLAEASGKETPGSREVRIMHLSDLVQRERRGQNVMPTPDKFKDYIPLSGQKGIANVAEAVAKVSTDPYLPADLASVYDVAKAGDPSLSIDQLNGTLARLHHEGKVRLHPFTRAIATIEHPESAFPMSGEIFYYVSPGNK